MSKTDFSSHTWDIIHAYFDDNSLVKHQIDSFNDFVLRKIDEIIDGFNPLDIHHQYLPEHEKFKHVLKLNISNPILSKPIIYEKDGSTKIMTPNDARLRNFSYSAPLNVDIEIHASTFDEETAEYTMEVKKLSNINLGKIPIMVNSRYCVLNSHPDCTNVNQCRYDVGGYFVINGNEKVVVAQDRICENKTHVFVNNKQTGYSHIAEIRSVSENKFGVPKTTTLKMSAKANQFGRYIRVNIHHIKHELPLFVLFRALGVESDKQILEYIVHDVHDPKDLIKEVIIKEMIGSIEEATGVLSSRDALEYMSKYLHINGYPKEVLTNKVQRLNILRSIMEKEFLPHVGKDFKKKALYLGYMVNKLIRCYLGLWEMDDRDSYINKRVDSPGVLMANLFRQYYGKMVKDMKNMLQKEINSGSWKAVGKFGGVLNKVNVYKIIKSTTIESGLKFALATGNWGIKSNKNKQGVAQVLNRMTYNATLSHLRRINTPIEKTGKLVQPRKLHSTQWGYICPAETPEGASVGLVKNMSMTTNITIASNSTNVRTVLKESGMQEFDGTNIAIFADSTKLIVNGDILGVHDNPVDLYAKLKELKRLGAINIHTGVSWNIQKNEININTEGGRCVRPLYIVSDNLLAVVKLVGTDGLDALKKEGKMWRNLVLAGCIEYLDVEETNLSLIAMKLNDLIRGDKGANMQARYTHMEIHPSLMLGVLAGIIPFSDHNQAPRNCYQSSMGKQAIGVYASNYRHRFDTIAHVLDYPQKPIVETKISQLTHTDEMPCGVNVIVAIMTYTGFNQEDSVIINKSALDRGLFSSTFYRTYKEQCNKNHSNGEEEFFANPSNMVNTKGNKPFNYAKLNKDGFVPENTFVDSGDIIIGKCMPQKIDTVISYKDTSISLKNNEFGFIDKNSYGDQYFTNVNGDGYNFTKVRMRNMRIPTIGDKFSSRHGQKGTMGMMYRQEDMPFSQDGIVPDIIMNPHAVPSRMTIAQLMECLLGKACTAVGTYGDATPFTDLSVEDIANVLQKQGIERYGNEIMYNPMTGEQMETIVFIGPTFYQRLKHMTIDKTHSRSANGPVVTLTRQPAEGRARSGGLRLGEMELDTNLAHGISSFLKERFMEMSDNYRVIVCRKCGMPAIANPEKNKYNCKSCKNTTMFSEVRIPYAAKLLFQELQSMSLGVRFLTG